MAFQIFSQRDPAWAGHALGSGAGELGPYGCFETCFSMVAWDAYDDLHLNPAQLDDAMTAQGIFQGDLLPDNALDRMWPDRFQTHTDAGFDQNTVNAVIASPEWYAIVCIHNPAVGVAGYHFMVMYTPTQVADPWWGKVMSLASWGGPGVVVKTVYVKSLRAQREAAAKAAADAAAAAAKAQADAAAALAAAQAQAAAAQAAAEAAAKAKAEADAAAAQAAADAAAQDAAAKAAADAASQAAATLPGKATPPSAPPSLDFWAILQNLILALARRVRHG